MNRLFPAALVLAVATANAQAAGNWSAEQLLGAEVRAHTGEEIGEVKDLIVRGGRLEKVVVEVGGFLEAGDQHIGVPWDHAIVSPELDWIEVPLKEVEGGTYSLFGRMPQGERAEIARRSWRVKELIGDVVSLRDAPRYGIATDVVFDASGRMVALIIERGEGAWGPAGLYAHPYAAHDEGQQEVRLPYGSADLVRQPRFDYLELDRLLQGKRS